jgi:hypothetical protein
MTITHFQAKNIIFLPINLPLLDQFHTVFRIGHPYTPDFVCFDTQKPTYRKDFGGANGG